MLSVLQDGLTILGAYREAVIFFFVTAMGFGFLILKYGADPDLPLSIKLAAAPGVGGVILCLLTYIAALLGQFGPALLRPAGFIIFLCAVILLVQALFRREFKVRSDPVLMPVVLAISLLLLVRLSFLKHILLPAYSDSPIHYQILTGILHPELAGHSRLSLGNVLDTYYHFGFHSLAAWLTSMTGFDPADMISLLGQIFLVLAPLSVFFLAYTLTRNAAAASFSALLTFAGWMMPAFAVNWGKFPALGSLAMMPAVLPFFLPREVGDLRKPSRWLWIAVLTAGVTLMHTRIILCILMAVACWYLSRRIQTENELKPAQSIRLALFYILSLWPMIDLIRNFYLNPVVLVIFLLLLPFAFQAHARLCIAVFFLTFGLWLIVFVPSHVNENVPLLLDRQFVEMMLYLPFSILGGAGFAGLLKKLPSQGWQLGLAAALLAAVMFNLLRGASVSPDGCCDYFKQDDQHAFGWLAENSPKGTLVLIPAFDDNGKVVGTDSGIWIYPLLGRDTNKLPFNTNWNSSRTLEEICNFGAQKLYIYMGGRDYSFADSQLARDTSFKPVFEAGQVRIYEVTGCP
jgi:hypothetical protein